MKADDERDFREFAAARTPSLLRTAYLLSGDWHTAEDVVSTATVKLYTSWRRVSRADNPAAYARQVVVRTWLDERRRPWRREHATDELPEAGGPAPDPATDAVARRADLRRLLAQLPARQRAVLVLRFYDDLSIERTAQILDCSNGAVRSLTVRALATLRSQLPAGVTTLVELEEAP